MNLLGEGSSDPIRGLALGTRGKSNAKPYLAPYQGSHQTSSSKHGLGRHTPVIPKMMTRCSEWIHMCMRIQITANDRYNMEKLSHSSVPRDNLEALVSECVIYCSFSASFP